MTLQEIKSAIFHGKKVFWKNKGYVVTGKLNNLNIVYAGGGLNENCIGLTWSDGITLNGEEEDFFTE